MLKPVVLLNIFVGVILCYKPINIQFNHDTFCFKILRIEISKEQHSFDIINVAFDQFNASFLNRSINSLVISNRSLSLYKLLV